MPLMTLKEVLADAYRRHYGVGAFNVINMEMLNAVLRAAEEEQSPVILAFAEVHQKYMPMESIAPVMVKAAQEAAVPVVVHFDHGEKFENLIKIMHHGFTSVMFDGSTLPFEENVRRTQEIVRIARILGVSVEAELGHVGGAEGGPGGEDDPAANYTDVGQAEDFVRRTGVDALAVAIGTAHGVYRSLPILDLDRLAAIKKRVPVPLVLHGGSGVSDEAFRRAIANGIAKINIFTDMSLAAVGKIKNSLHTCTHSGCDSGCADSCMLEREESKSWPDPSREDLVRRVVARVLQEIKRTEEPKTVHVDNYPDLIVETTAGIKDEVKRKIRLFGGQGKAMDFARS